MPPSTPVRVMIVAPSFDILGGQSTQAALLCKCLSNEAAVDVSFLATNPQLPGVLRRLQSIKYLRTLLTAAVYVAQLLARTPRQDVVHVFSAAHTSFLISATPAILIATGFGKGTVLHYHSGEADLHLRRWRRTAARTMRLVDAIVVPSRYLVDQFAGHGFNVRLISNVIEPERFEFRERQPLTPMFLCNRQLQPYCNVACVLRAFALVQARVDDARLIVAADGSERRELETLAGELALTHTEFVGWVHPERVGELYASADVYLNGVRPSRQRPDVDPRSVCLRRCRWSRPMSPGSPSWCASGETGMLVPRRTTTSSSRRRRSPCSPIPRARDPGSLWARARNARVHLAGGAGAVAGAVSRRCGSGRVAVISDRAELARVHGGRPARAGQPALA